MSDSPIEATQLPNRIASLDFLRGLAILGILFINAENFAYPDSWSPWKFGFEGPIDHSTRFWVYFLTQGKFYSMFALLFGVGFYIFLERLEKKRAGLVAMDIYARRLLWLFVIGILHAYLIWDGDILFHYAVCGFFLFPFRSVSSPYLLLIVAFLCLLELNRAYEQVSKRQNQEKAYTAALRVPANQRSEQELKSIRFWEEKTAVRSAGTAAVSIQKETYWIGLKETYARIGVHKGTIFYKGLLFRTLLLMLLGIILYRSGIFHDYKVWRLYRAVTLGVLTIGLVMNYYRYEHWTYAYYSPVTNLWQEWLYTFPKETLGLGYILLFNGLYQKYLSHARYKLISQVGRTALTNYILQSLLLGLLFYGYGLAQLNQFSRVELLGVVLFIWLLQLILCHFYLKRYQQGPLEELWRRLTYKSFRTQEKPPETRH